MEKQNKELKIEMAPEVATGNYSNLTIISHGPQEFFLDFIAMAPNMPQAKVQSRIIMTPENAKNLLHALAENVKKYEDTFGEITHKTPKKSSGNSGEIPNPFMMGGNA